MRALLFLALTRFALSDGDGLNGEVITLPPAPIPTAEPQPLPPPPVEVPVTDGTDILGVPQAPEEVTTADEVRAAPGSDEADCKSRVESPLRAMVFKHYQNFQDMQLAQGQPLPPKAPEKSAHLLAMILKESAGDTTDVTDMKGREVGTFHAMSDLSRWNALFASGKLTYDKQTNYGLAQQSMDRLLAPGSLSGAVAKMFGSKPLTSGQSVRKLLSAYQDFAQGRVTQKDGLIPEKIAKDPNAPDALKARVRAGLKAAAWHCGTRFLFKEGYAGADGEKALEDAMASIAYCDVGAKNPDPKNDAQSKCFARWVTLCPALNLDIAILSPDSYFATRGASPVCMATFQKLTKPAPKQQ